MSNLSLQSDRVSRKLDELSLKLDSLSAISPLNDKVDHLTKKLKTLTSDVREGLNANRLIVMIIAVVIVGVQIMQLFMYKGYADTTQTAIQGVRERTEWALTKLERLENR